MPDRTTLNFTFRKEVNKIINELASEYNLDIFDFDIAYADDNDLTVFLRIKHKAYPNNIYFIGTTDDYQNALYLLAPFRNVTKGDVYEPINNIEEVLNHWFRYFTLELNALDEEEINRKAQLISNKIALSLQSQITEADGFFNNQELKKLKDRLDDFEAHFEQQKTVYSLTQESLLSLKNTIEEIKNIAEKETQQKWYDKTLHKLGNWAGRIDKIDKVVRAIEKTDLLLDKLPL
ncbi:hypothetical protein [Aliivibrio wodanis]|uniref:hypothetical protein n=1 Tax=Aliivibrio wodanis TaxID=80852 RepID=UPI00406C5266